MPETGQTVFGSNVCRAAGGKGANQAYAAARLGGDVSMLGAVGDDSAGKSLIAGLQKAGVDTSGIRICSTKDTGQAFVTVEKAGENAIIVIPGANRETTAEYLMNHREYIDAADIIVMQLEIPFEAVCFAKNRALHGGKLLILDPAPADGRIEDSFWKGIDYIKPNETELEILSGRRLYGEHDICAAAGELVEKGVRNVIVSLGEKGCLLVRHKETIHFDAVKVSAVDTTAAGDAFTGAFAVALSEGKTAEQAISFAQAAAAAAVTKKGAQSSIPSRRELEDGWRKAGGIKGK